MPILLTTPFNPGDLDPGNTYAEAKIKNVYINLHDKCINVAWIAGNTVSGSWVQGAVAQVQDIWIQDGDYDSIVQEQISGSDNGCIYEGVKRVLYNYLIDHGCVSGSII